MHKAVFFLLVVALSPAATPQSLPAPFGTPPVLPSTSAPYRHGYYLFLSDPPVACEQCYVPLLLTVAPLEDIAKEAAGQDCDLITTYERDSIYTMNGIVHVAASDVVPAPRTIRIRKRNYRYQEITAAEIVHLFEHPLGTIPVSRVMFFSDLPWGPPMEHLIAAFRAVK